MKKLILYILLPLFCLADWTDASKGWVLGQFATTQTITAAWIFSQGISSDSPTFVVDAANNAVGIGTATPITVAADNGSLTISGITGNKIGFLILRNSTTGKYSFIKIHPILPLYMQHWMGLLTALS